MNDVDELARRALRQGQISELLMWRHYHRAVRKEDAKVFWQILPLRAADNIVPIAKASTSI